MVFVGRLPKLRAWQTIVERNQLDELLKEATKHGPDAHVLFARAGGFDGKNVVLLSGNTPAADFWALATLRQMVFPKASGDYIREGRILDFPRFKNRGNKRPRQWEWRYKANYAWFFSQSKFPSGVELKEYHRRAAAWIHHGSPLRATDAEMDQLIAGFENERGRRVPGARECYEQGCREFVLKFDDTGSELSEATRKKFNSGDPARDYFDALHYFLVGMHRRIKAIDRNVKIYFMPRPYWHNSFEQREFAEALLARGPLPKDMGLSVCGPEVISWTIPTACLKDYRELYGLEGKAQIYDNFGRGGEYFAYHGRDADLWTGGGLRLSGTGHARHADHGLRLPLEPGGVRSRPLAQTGRPRACRPRSEALSGVVGLRQLLQPPPRLRVLPESERRTSISCPRSTGA